MRRVVALILVLGAVPARASDACAPCPISITRTWRELRTEHFVLATDVAPDEAEDIAEQLEVLRGAVLRGLFSPPPEVPGPLLVVAFARVEEFRRFVSKPFDGMFFRRPAGGEVVLLRGEVGRVTRASILAHELTHAIVAHALPRTPRWLGEGLASYMEAVGEGSGGETLRVGAPPAHRLAAARRVRVAAADLFAGRSDVDGVYATSWLLVHFLLSKHRERFVAFERKLGTARGWEAAWRDVFPEWDPANASSTAALDQALLGYVRDDGQYVEQRFPARGQGAYRVTEIEPEKVRALCAALPARKGPIAP